MQRHPIITKDGSPTIAVPGMNVMYHSIHGAIRESKHVYIDAGLSDDLASDSPALLEMGFGTALNALLTLIEAERLQKKIHYTTLELYPLEREQVQQLNYCRHLSRPDLQPLFERMHDCEWEKDIIISPFFILHKKNISLIDFQSTHSYDVIYFDAFAPSAQPELWTQEIFEKLGPMMRNGGILVTYCSKGIVRRAMQAAGLMVEKRKGPPGKREMLRGRK